MNKTKKHLLFVVTIALLSSCGTKEGAPEKKYRISSVSAVETRFMDGAQYYTSGNYISEKWNWDGNEMYRIDYGGYHAYSENFFYDNRGRIVYTTIPAYDLKSEYKYDGRMLESIEVTRNDVKIMSFVFTHNDEDEISTIDVTSTNTLKYGIENDIINGIIRPLTRMVGSQGAKAIMDKMASDVKSSKASDGEMVTSRFFLTWKNENLIRIAQSNNSYVVDLQYDNKLNPYAQLIGYHNMIETGFRYQIMSKNNITSISIPSNPTIYYTYQYKDDYPTHRVASYSYRTINTDFDSVTITITQAETINYLD